MLQVLEDMGLEEAANALATESGIWIETPEMK